VKATSLLAEHQHVFQDVRVLSDIRPIFGENPQELPIATVITHVLKISFLVRDHIEEFFVAMDTPDVQKMIDVLERAKAKTQSLQTFIRGTNLPHVDGQ
jgi:hypothetical protein